MRNLFLTTACLLACSGTANVYIPPDEAGAVSYDANFSFPDGASLPEGSADVSSPLEASTDAGLDAAEEEAAACGWVCNQFGYMNTCNSQLADCQTAVNNCSPIMGPCGTLPVCVVPGPNGLYKAVCQANDVWMWTDPGMSQPPQPCMAAPVCPSGFPCTVQLAGAPALSGMCQ